MVSLVIDQVKFTYLVQMIISISFFGQLDRPTIVLVKPSLMLNSRTTPNNLTIKTDSILWVHGMSFLLLKFFLYYYVTDNKYNIGYETDLNTTFKNIIGRLLELQKFSLKCQGVLQRYTQLSVSMLVKSKYSRWLTYCTQNI